MNTAKRNLTARQLEVLAKVSSGKTSKAIAAELGVNKSAIHYHLDRIYKRLDVESGMQAVMAAIRMGLLACPCGRHEAGYPHPVPGAATDR